MDLPFSDRLSDYDYRLPESLIAQCPAEPRDSSRMLVIDRARGTWEHRYFRDLPEYLRANDLLVVNNSKVLKARLLGYRLRQENGAWIRGGKVEFVLLEQLGPRTWEGLFHASARYVRGLRFEIPTPDGKGIRGVLIRGVSESPHGTVVAELDRDPIEADAGELPLPHYIRSPGGDSGVSYQTVYAKDLGSAAAPTAGLHFTSEVIERLKQKGVSWEEVTLHVGLGTFRPIQAPKLGDHRMHEERYEISPQAAQVITAAKHSSGQGGQRVVAVGTTCVRTLESAWKGEIKTGHLEVGSGRTSLFLRPGHATFRVVDVLLTNFHLPQSTLLVLVCAFAGRDLILKAYEEAVRMNYRFFSYGDCMLIL